MLVEGPGELLEGVDADGVLDQMAVVVAVAVWTVVELCMSFGMVNC